MENSAQHDISDLNRLYTEGESCDSDIFAEMRSNLLLYAGDHYTKKTSPFYKRIRDSKELQQEQKLRLTKNHVQYICDTYVNNIVSPNPGVGFSPKNEKEVHDQKVAQMHHAVWRDAHERYNIDDKIDDWADSFVQIGEVAVKIYYDPMRGKLKAYGQKTDKDGAPLFLDPSGNETLDDGSAMGAQWVPAPDKNSPIYTGEFVFEQIYGFNLLRPTECKDLREAEWLGIRKMSDVKTLMLQFPDKEEYIKSSLDETYMVFDTTKGGYSKTKGQALVVEYYFRPSPVYPNGYFYITTKEGILAEGELPGGIFPIIVQPFKKFATAPRGRSPIKTMRPYQAEINRGSSKVAEHQITLGDDKLLTQHGTKVSSGVHLPGIRGVTYTGAEPKILPGRDGSQYLTAITQNIDELYRVMGAKEDNEELPAQLDPYVMLYRSARQKKKFQRYIKRFEKFLVEIVKTYLKLAKVHLPDDALIYAVGAPEQVNISEFRSVADICYEVKVEAQSEDIETKLGKQIVINHSLQYIGSRLQPEDIGKLMRQMPYANFDESFDDLTLDYDNSINDILALDRGERPPVNQYDKHVYCIKRLTSRTRKGDFKFLPPQVQQAYQDKINLHQQFEAQNQLAIQRAQQGLIPTGGYLAKCDLYVPNPTDPNKKERVTLPAEAIAWLVKQIQAQQAGMIPLQGLPEGSQAELADKFTQMGNTVPDAVLNSGGGFPPMNTQAMPSR